MDDRPTHIIIHRTNSLGGNARRIDEDHRKNRKFSMIGYHWLILNGRIRWGGRSYDARLDGVLEQGRPEDARGAHAVGFNDCPGVCLVGRGPFTPKQMDTARALVSQLRRQYGIPVENVLGHDETPGCPKSKVCPNMDMDAFRESLRGFHPKQGG